jgi:putative FmdB family regulatory protein
MPTYEYECAECGYRFEVFQNMSDAPVQECEKCKGDVRRLIFGGTGVIFKGSGFYVTDNKGKSKVPAADTKKDGDRKDPPAAAAEKSGTEKAVSETRPEKKQEKKQEKKETVPAK